MNNYWLSWWHEERFGAFELHSPWWVTGESIDNLKSICAAVKADNAQLAVKQIYMAYDKVPHKIEIRFCIDKPEYWTPFSDRFPKADWMKWE